MIESINRMPTDCKSKIIIVSISLSFVTTVRNELKSLQLAN